MRVLIAVDDSEFSRVAVDEVGERLWAADTEFQILSVVAIPAEGYWQDFGLTVNPQVIERLQAQAQKLVAGHLNTLRHRLGEQITIEASVTEGHASDSIVRVAAGWGADLIVMGSHGLTGLKRFVLGSVAESVLEAAPCSVEIVKLRGQAEQTIPKQSHKMVVLY